MSHIVLLGDSILDNGAYSSPEPDVASHLRSIVGEAHRVSLLARDGDVIRGVLDQLLELPRDATQIVVSAGGNDILGHQWLLGEPAESVAAALLVFAAPLASFGARYREVASRLRETHIPTALCTVYNGNLGAEQAPAATVAVRLFNDVIQSLAYEHGFGLLELRRVCTGPDDYANPIEPSGRGGEKIAQAIAGWVG